MEKEKTIDSKYIQQHLANERTFLAWVRTSITVAGVGFLSAGLVLRTGSDEQFEHRLAGIVGIGSVILASVIMLMAVQNYFVKQKGINEETYRSPRFIIVATFSCLAVIDLLMVVLIYLYF